MDPPTDFTIPEPTCGTLHQTRPLLCLVEGRHDAEFLRRLSANLSREDPDLPDLGHCERDGRLVFIPFGGGDVFAWSDRFAPLQCPELHLLDREISPETAIRLQAIARVNARPGCRAFLTSKRSLENYLHPLALFCAGGVELEFDDEACVAGARRTLQGFWNFVEESCVYLCIQFTCVQKEAKDGTTDGGENEVITGIEAAAERYGPRGAGTDLW